MRSLCLTLSAAIICAAAPISDEALRDFWFKSRISEMQQIAQSGDVRVQWWMGLMLQNGDRTPEAIT